MTSETRSDSNSSRARPVSPLAHILSAHVSHTTGKAFFRNRVIFDFEFVFEQGAQPLAGHVVIVVRVSVQGTNKWNAANQSPAWLQHP